MQARRGRFATVAVALLAAGGGGSLAAAEPSAGETYIVVYRDGVAPGPETRAQARQLGFDVDYRYSAAFDGYAAELTPAQIEQVRGDPDVAFAGPDGVAHAASVVPLAPGEPRPPTGVRRIRAATATTAREASTSRVAVLDSGIMLRHPDLRTAAGTDCVEPGTPPGDSSGHGTHIAGTIGALNDGAGVVGVAPGTRLIAVRVLDEAGVGTFAEIICGIDWITANHVARRIDVANMSLTAIESIDPTQPCATTTSPLHKAICNSTAAGVTYVAAAGNDGRNFDDPGLAYVPAAYPEVLAVTSVSDFDGRPGALTRPTCTPFGSDDTKSPFSNYALSPPAQAHTIAAPGDCIRSTWNRPPFYHVASGTSVAAPHVAGVVALCIGELGSGPGRCAGQAPAEVIATIRNRSSAAHPGFGFRGDPDRPSGSRFYGYLVHPIVPAS